MNDLIIKPLLQRYHSLFCTGFFQRFSFALITFKLIFIMGIGSQQSVFAAEIYRWVDKHGKTHFSDIKPIVADAEQYSPTELPQINFKATPKIRFISHQRNKKNRRITKSSPKNNCQKIKQSITNLDNQLRKKQLAKDFDNINQKLQSLRWQKIKKC